MHSSSCSAQKFKVIHVFMGHPNVHLLPILLITSPSSDLHVGVRTLAQTTGNNFLTHLRYGLTAERTSLCPCKVCPLLQRIMRSVYNPLSRHSPTSCAMCSCKSFECTLKRASESSGPAILSKLNRILREKKISYITQETKIL